VAHVISGYHSNNDNHVPNTKPNVVEMLNFDLQGMRMDEAKV